MKKAILLVGVLILIVFNSVVVFNNDNDVSLFSLKSASAISQAEMEELPGARRVNEITTSTQTVDYTHTCIEYLWYGNTSGPRPTGSTASCTETSVITSYACIGSGTLWCAPYSETTSVSGEDCTATWEDDWTGWYYWECD